VYSSSQGCRTATGTRMPHWITQCYLPPGRGDIERLESLRDLFTINTVSTVTCDLELSTGQWLTKSDATRFINQCRSEHLQATKSRRRHVRLRPTFSNLDALLVLQPPAPRQCRGSSNSSNLRHHWQQNAASIRPPRE